MGETWVALLEGIGQMGASELAGLGGLIAALSGILLTLLQLMLLRRQLKLDALIKIMDSNREIVSIGFDYPGI